MGAIPTLNIKYNVKILIFPKSKMENKWKFTNLWISIDPPIFKPHPPPQPKNINLNDDRLLDYWTSSFKHYDLWFFKMFNTEKATVQKKVIFKLSITGVILAADLYVLHMSDFFRISYSVNWTSIQSTNWNQILGIVYTDRLW